MPKATPSAIQNRYDIAYFFEVADGNPNGDPDAGNMPRIDPETNHALVTDVCLKRKIRNYVGMKHGGASPYEIFIKEKAILNDLIERPYQTSEEVRGLLKAWDEYKRSKKKKSKEPKPRPERHYEDAARQWMCEHFFDIRAFGAVMSTGKEKDLDDDEQVEGEAAKKSDNDKSKIRRTAGQVRGPVQVTMARSLHPVLQLEHSITRCAVASEEESDAQDGGNRTMGRKFTIPYALFRNHFFISPMLADPDRNGTGFSEADLALVKESLNMMFDHDHSAARGTMAPVEILAFRHDSAMGNARADQLFSLITCEAAPDVRSGERPPRSKADFTIRVDEKRLPEGVTLERWLIH